MYQPDPSPSPEGTERARRRGLFSRSQPPPMYPADMRTEAVISAYQQIVTDRLEDGLRAIQQTANSLMHEIAAEVWRAAGGDKDAVQAKILEALSRDQAIRSLVAHSDERFQDLAVRTARLEEALTTLAEDTRAARQALAGSVEALEHAVGAPAVKSVEGLRNQLERVTRQMAAAFEALADRDKVIVDTVQERIREHGELIATETGRIAKAMEAYVQEGVNALGQLAGRVDAQVEAVAGGDVTARIDAAMEEHLHRLGEHLELMQERVGIESRDILASIDRLETRVAARASQEINRTLEARVMGLAQLVRSDSEALRGELVRTTAAADERVARVLDEQLGRVSEALTSATRWTVEEMTRRVREETALTIQGQLETAVTRLGQTNEQTIGIRLDEALSSIERNGVRVADTLDAGLERLGRVAEEARRVEEGELAKVFDERITALARMVRSDNQTLATKLQLAADQDASKQTLRAVKELEANLPNEVQEIVDRRVQAIAEQLHHDVQATTESVARLGDMLERKVDEMTARIAERYDSEIQVVVDRMGDAMHALASLGRQKADRIDLE